MNAEIMKAALERIGQQSMVAQSQDAYVLGEIARKALQDAAPALDPCLPYVPSSVAQG